MGLLWIFFALAVVVVSVLSGVQVLRRGDASIAPNCDEYSIALLLAVVVAHLVMAAFLILWLCKGAFKCCRKKRVNRATLSSLCLLFLIYAFIVAGFSVSVLVFANQTRSVSDFRNSSLVDMGMSGNDSVGGVSGSGEDCDGDMASGSGDMGSGNVTCNNQSVVQPRKEENCVHLESQPFILVVVFLGLLLIFIAAISCLLCYECSHNGFCYQREFYDPTVTVFENETTFSAE